MAETAPATTAPSQPSTVENFQDPLFLSTNEAMECLALMGVQEPPSQAIAMKDDRSKPLALRRPGTSSLNIHPLGEAWPLPLEPTEECPKARTIYVTSEPHHLYENTDPAPDGIGKVARVQDTGGNGYRLSTLVNRSVSVRNPRLARALFEYCLKQEPCETQSQSAAA